MKAIIVLAAAGLMGGSALAASGAVLYKTNCAACHGPTGKGMTAPLVVPGLAGGHMTNVLTAAKGRDYAINTVLHGLQGEVKIAGKSYNGVMPGLAATLSDDDVATVLNYVSTTWTNKMPAGQKPFTAADVKKLRATTLKPDAVLKSRPAIK